MLTLISEYFMHKTKHIHLPSRIAQYKLTNVLGSGGMGVVSKAVRITDGKEVALKILHTPQIGGFGLLREIRAIQKLHHPGIIQLIDSGSENNLVWYAMEFLNGSTLRDQICNDNSTYISDRNFSWESTWDIPVSESHTLSMEGDDFDASQWINSVQRNFDFSSIQPRSVFDERAVRLLKYAAQIASALDYIHARGVVHCDVKPDNILVTATGKAVLIDFGLAVHQSSQANSKELLDSGLFFGTVMYLSPERILRQPFDARADLYALGCMMYEMVVGLPPVFCTEKDEILGYTHTIQNPRPSFYVDHVPPELDDLIVHLVSRDPKDRPGYARNVLYTLRQLGFVEQNIPPVSSKGYLYRTQYLGRDTIINQLKAQVDCTRAKTGSAFFIKGERGIGKTSLASHLLHYVRAQKISCITGQTAILRKGDKASEGQVLSIFSDMFRKLVDRFLSDKERLSLDIFHANTQALVSVFPFLSMLPTNDLIPELKGISPRDSQQRILDEVIWVIEYLAQEEPLVLVFDDIQWADPLSIACLKLLLNRIARKQWFVVLLGEDGCSLFDEREDVNKIQLEPLHEEFHKTFIQEMLGGVQFPAELLQYARNQTKGNPLFIRLCIQAAIDEKYLHLNSEGNWRFDWRVAELMNASVPESVSQILASSLKRINAAQRQLCLILSVFGQATDVLMLERVMNIDAVDILHTASEDGLNSILSVRNEDSTSWLDFVHWGVEELLIESIEPHVLYELHLKVVHLLEKVPHVQKDKVRMARHYERANKKSRARELYVQEARDSARSCAFQHAHAIYEKAISLYEREPEIYNIKFEFVEKVLRPQALFEKSALLLQDIIASSDDRDLVIKSLYHLSSVQVSLGDLEQAEHFRQKHREYCQQSQDKSLTCDNLFLEVLIVLDKHLFDIGLHKMLALQKQIPPKNKALYDMVTSDIAHLHLEFGRYQEAVGALQDLLMRAEEQKKEGIKIRVMTSLSLAYMYLGELDKALDYAQKSKNIAKQYGLRWQEIYTMGNQGLVYMQRGDFQECISISNEVLLLAKDMGIRKAELVSLINILLCRVELAQYTRAQRIIDQCMPKEKELGPYLYGYILYAKARMNRYMGQSEHSLDDIIRGLALFKKHQLNQPHALLLCEHGHILLAMNGNINLVQEKLQEAKSWRDSLGVNEFSELGIAVFRLELAVKTYLEGKEIFVGSRKEDLPAQVRRSVLEAHPYEN